jgi:hypothetical protein
VAATVADLAGLSDSPFPGRSLLEGEGPGEPVLSEMGSTGNANSVTGKGWIKSLVKGKWHFILRQSGKAELYDLAGDPRDSINLADTREGMLVTANLRRELGSIIKSASLKDWPAEGVTE